MASGPIGVSVQSERHHVAHEFLARPAQEHHAVQFYEDDFFLADVVAHYAGAGLAAAEPTLLIATAPHCDAFVERLAAKGVDVAGARARGGLMLLDAHELLGRIIVDGRLDAARLRDLVGPVLAELGRTSCHAPLRIYGEAVDLLWANGNSEAALAVEAEWNALGEERSFSLLCAYDMGHFPGGEDGVRLSRVCNAHSHVIPTERYARLGDDDSRLREVVQLQQRAHALENEIADREAVEQQLRDSLRLRDDFLAIAGHELKTPLAAAQLMMESLLRLAEGGEPATVRDRLTKATRSLDRLARLVDGLLDVRRLVTGCIALTVEELDLVGLVREVIEGAAPALQSARCSVQLGGDAQVHGRWDRQRLEQLVGNLLSNACKYGGGQPIAIHVARHGERALLVVHDRGGGIAPDDQARIFERFERAGVTSEAWGLGLGLWIARQAVEAHGGTIRVASELGQGSTFTVELPLG